MTRDSESWAGSAALGPRVEGESNVSLVIECVLIDCSDLEQMRAFWQAALDLEHVWTGPSGGYLLAAREGSHPPLGLMPCGDEKSGKNRLHLDLRPDNQEAEVERLEQLGAVRVDIGQRDVTWVVMADPEGNEFCVLRSRPVPTGPEPTQRQ
jgi:predicted enzyme related to lactoylglutathione lyase